MLKTIAATAILMSATVLPAGASHSSGKRFLIFTSGPNGTSQRASDRTLLRFTVALPSSAASPNNLRTPALWGLRARGRF